MKKLHGVNDAHKQLCEAHKKFLKSDTELLPSGDNYSEFCQDISS